MLEKDNPETSGIAINNHYQNYTEGPRRMTIFSNTTEHSSILEKV